MIQNYITFPKTRIVKLLTGLSMFSGFILLSEPVLSQVEIASSDPPQSGMCYRIENGSSEERVVENCFQNVQWKRIPNHRPLLGGQKTTTGYIGENTIVRNGDSINFDYYLVPVPSPYYIAGYMRMSANCKTHVYTAIKGSRKLQRGPGDPYNSADREFKKVINMACSLAND